MLSPAQVELLSGALAARGKVLVDEIGAKLADAQASVGSGAIDQIIEGGDSAAAAVLIEADLIESKRDIDELRDIETAARRIADGSYGYCADCGDEIAFERLQVQPAALRCVRCQGKVEREHGTGGGPTM